MNDNDEIEKELSEISPLLKDIKMNLNNQEPTDDYFKNFKVDYNKLAVSHKNNYVRYIRLMISAACILLFIVFSIFIQKDNNKYISDLTDDDIIDYLSSDNQLFINYLEYNNLIYNDLYLDDNILSDIITNDLDDNIIDILIEDENFNEYETL